MAAGIGIVIGAGLAFAAPGGAQCPIAACSGEQVVAGIAATGLRGGFGAAFLDLVTAALRAGFGPAFAVGLGIGIVMPGMWLWFIAWAATAASNASAIMPRRLRRGR